MHMHMHMPTDVHYNKTKMQLEHCATSAEVRLGIDQGVEQENPTAKAWPASSGGVNRILFTSFF